MRLTAGEPGEPGAEELGERTMATAESCDKDQVLKLLPPPPDKMPALAVPKHTAFMSYLPRVLFYCLGMGLVSFSQLKMSGSWRRDLFLRTARSSRHQIIWK